MGNENEFALILTVLGIANIKIKEIVINRKGEMIITVESTEKGTYCHRCGGKADRPCGHGREILLRHLPVSSRKCYIRIIPVRYACPHCKGKKGRALTTTQKLSWYEPRSPHTKAYEEHILLELVNSTVEDVSIKKDIGYEAIMGIIRRHLSSKVNWREIKKLGILGIDEISLKKGHKDFVAIITSKVEGELVILAVLKDRLKKTVKDFLLSIPKQSRKFLSVYFIIPRT